MKEKLKKFIKKHGTTIYIGVSGVVISVVAYKMGYKSACKWGDAGILASSKIGLVKFFDLDGNEISYNESVKLLKGHTDEIMEMLKKAVM